MFEVIWAYLSNRTAWQLARNALDIFVVAFVVYRALVVIRGTRAAQIGMGLGVVFLVYLLAKALDLTAVLSLLSLDVTSIILILIVVFQNDIRRALIRVGSRAMFSAGREQQSRVIDEVVGAATELAKHRIGALIAFEQDANLSEFTKSEGITLDSNVTKELLVAMFYPESLNKLHDGAVVIRDLKIARAGVFFPMPETKIADASLGSRHRAAIGITEETDAVVVVVSEERGTISFCFSGNIVSNLDGPSLRQALLGLFGRGRKRGIGQRVAEFAASVRPPASDKQGGKSTGATKTPVSSKAPGLGRTLSPALGTPATRIGGKGGVNVKAVNPTKTPLTVPLTPKPSPIAAGAPKKVTRAEAPPDSKPDDARDSASAPPSSRKTGSRISSPMKNSSARASKEPSEERTPTSTSTPMPTGRSSFVPSGPESSSEAKDGGS